MQNYLRKELINANDLNESITSEVVDLDGASVGTIQMVHSALATAKTFDSGRLDVVTATFETKANTDAGDYIVIAAQDGSLWAVAADMDGSDPEPTGAVWDAIPAAQKAQVDLTAATDAASVAAAFEVAFDALTGFTALVVTDDSAANGTMLFTQAVRGITEDAQVYNADDSGAGSIVVVETTAGVDPEVDITANSVGIPNHGYVTGSEGRLTSTGTLPAGVTTGVDYYVIVVDEDNIQFAASLVDAEAGDEIDLTNQGSNGAVNTFTLTALSGSLQYQVTNVANPGSTDWVNKGSAVSITGGATTSAVEFDKKELAYSKLRAVYTHTDGQFDLQVIINLKS